MFVKESVKTLEFLLPHFEADFLRDMNIPNNHLRICLKKLGTDKVEHAICRGVVHLFTQMEKPDMTFSQLLLACKGTFTALASQYAQEEEDARRADPNAALVAGWADSWKQRTAVVAPTNRLSSGGDGESNRMKTCRASDTMPSTRQRATGDCVSTSSMTTQARTTNAEVI
ncbi:hypothetical protein EJ03DRAFT_352726 [Teratosphaeria nubilosa]|uniref:Uncharacterized protein n=1 Tax=Teratosphaeria nubilosa TaxID=161662 RepID=A0A6G1L6G2_9PEZI|nr:hypothetical protein EJ03DRAFT_352726 [Teratosphaeria nubilosa]